jgi:FkbM family methyltransferase
MPVDYEQLLQGVYERYLKPGDVVVDAGGHVGRHAIPMARCVGAHGKAWVFEPLEQCQEQLIKILQAERSIPSNVIVLRRHALGEHDGTTEYVVALDAMAYSGLRERTYDVPTRLERVPVETRRLDSFMREFAVVNLIKIDVEGGELGVLRGAVQVISRFRPLVTFEFGLNAIGGYGITPRDMADYWEAMNYAVHDILGRPLSSDDFVTSAERQQVWDYVAIPAERRSLAATLFP